MKYFLFLIMAILLPSSFFSQKDYYSSEQELVINSLLVKYELLLMKKNNEFILLQTFFEVDSNTNAKSFHSSTFQTGKFKISKDTLILEPFNATETKYIRFNPPEINMKEGSFFVTLKKDDLKKENI